MKHLKLLLVLSLFAPAICSAGPAIAEFMQIVKNGYQTPEHKSCTKGYVLKIGEAARGDYLVTTGDGHDVPLRDAIKAHVPNDWNIHFVKPGLQNTKVAWDEGVLWHKWLASTAYKNKLAIVMNFKTHQLYIDRV